MGKYVGGLATGVALMFVACATGNGVDADPDPVIPTDRDAGPNTPSTDSKAIAYDVGGTVSGLAGTGLVLQNNGEDDLVVSANGAFTFKKTVAIGQPFVVTVKAQPNTPSQTCTVANGSGAVTGSTVSSVAVSCVTNAFNVGGTVSGLQGSGLVLQNNAGNDLPVASDGTFTFPTPQTDGTSFAVTVKADPKNPDQTCLVSGGTGVIAGGNVTTVTVNCSKKKYVVGGSVSGLQGSGLVVQNNAGNDTPITANGTFSFSTLINDLAAYAVTVKTQPTNRWQTCTVTNGSGNVAGSAVTSVAISCATNAYKVKVTVSGLQGSGLVLQNNGGNDLAIAKDGTFEFTQLVASGTGYAVSTFKNPTDKSQTCTVANGSGIMAGGDVNVNVTCSDAAYAVGGTISGLTGGSVVLTNNGGSDLTLGESGPFSFGTSVTSGSTYAVQVKTQPADRECVVTNGTGTVGNGPVTSVTVTCGHTGCRTVSDMLWCKDAVAARSCNTFCNAIGLGIPTISDAAWTAAQDTQAECSAIASAFGYGTVSVGAYGYACAEVRDSDFACSTATACPASHRTGSDPGNYWAVCPCAPARICGTAEEDLSTTISCPAGSVIQSVEYASYGLPNGSCGSFTNGSCHASASKAVVEGRCLGKTSCTIPATNDVFGDPCANVNKRIYVQVSCQ